MDDIVVQTEEGTTPEKEKQPAITEVNQSTTAANESLPGSSSEKEKQPPLTEVNQSTTASNESLSLPEAIAPSSDEPCTKKPKLSPNPLDRRISTTDTDPNTTNENEPVTSGDEKLSKRKQKKQRKLEAWAEKKKIKRLNERLKYRQKRLEAIATGQPTHQGPSRKALKHNTMEKSCNPFTVAIDLDFDELMIDKDICKCAKQLLWVYTYNRKAESPLQLYYTGLKEGSRLQDSLKRNDGYQNWDVHFRQQSYLDVFAQKNVVYLTSDSDDVLTEMDKDSVYVIGGLVDHNHHKGEALRRAEAKGLRTARLPLSEHVSIKTRMVLSITHVFDILLRVSQGQSWPKVLLDVLPMRKGAKPLDLLDENNADKEKET